MKINEVFKPIEGLFESPKLIASDTFGLTNVEYNRSLADELMNKVTQVYEDTPEYKLFRSGDDKDGTICVVSKSTWQLTYYVLYSVHTIPVIGTSATQVLLWRADKGARPSNVTQRVFFDVILDKWKTITSDTAQTLEGKRFWLTQLDEAYKRGFDVGMVAVSEDAVLRFDKNDGIPIPSDWADSQNAWGDDKSFENFRFIITSEKGLVQ